MEGYINVLCGALFWLASLCIAANAHAVDWQAPVSYTNGDSLDTTIKGYLLRVKREGKLIELYTQNTSIDVNGPAELKVKAVLADGRESEYSKTFMLETDEQGVLIRCNPACSLEVN